MAGSEMFAKRNQARISLLVVLATINYWFAVCVAAVVVGVGIVVYAVIKLEFVPTSADELRWLGIGLLVVAALSVVVGTFLALVRIPGQRRSLERRVLTETGALIATPEEQPRVRNLLEGLAIAADVPVPRFAVINDPAPNSFGVGTRPKNTIIGVTTGLIEKLSRDELEAVLAYEVSRIDGWDIALSSWTVALTSGAIGALETDDMKKLIGWLPIRMAQRLQVWALQDQGELRDRHAIQFTRNPHSLVDALQKLHDDPSEVRAVSRATAPLWVEFPAHAAGTTKSGARLARALVLDDRIGALRAVAGLPPEEAASPAP